MNAKPQIAATLQAQDLKARYQRAQALMPGLNSKNLVQNDTLVPHWIEQTDCFWYERTYNTGEVSFAHRAKEFRLVDAKALTNQSAFDHVALAKALNLVSTCEVHAETLPISNVHITGSPLTVDFTAFNQRWKFDGESCTCKLIDTDRVSTVAYNETQSPDGKHIAFIRDYNLWVREVTSGEERALTHDGEADFSYATPPTYYGVVSGHGPSAQWSPDSQRLFVLQVDTRKVMSLPMVDHVPSDGSLRPTVKHVKIAYPGDDNVEEYRLLAIEVANSRICKIDYPPIPASAADQGFFASQLGWWANDSQHAYFIHQERGDQVLHLVEFDTDNGTARIVFEESSASHINVKPETMDPPLHVFMPESQELIWWSERSGWGHFYLYDLNTGELKNPITQGEWRVRNVLYVDAARRELLIQTAGREPGRNPYYRDICRVCIDTGELTTLHSTDHDYVVHCQGVDLLRQRAGHVDKFAVGVALGGNYIVTTRSRVDQVPASLLLNRDGDILVELEIADISNLPDGWQWPEPLKLTAADGKTELSGILFRPTDFAEDQQYPVINLIVSGPRFAAVPQGSFHNSGGYADRFYFLGAALAELGFIVVIINSRGTPLRDKAFQDCSYGWMPSSANCADHQAGLEQLAQRYPAIDLNRVGIFSPTGYSGGLQNLMERPDFYQVGVINHHQDPRLICGAVEADKFHGVEGAAKDNCFPEQLVEDWTGKLLLVHPMEGPFTACYPPAASFRLVEALQQANKDFDLLMVPHIGVGVMGNYEMRRAWDYLVRHLQGVEPPKEFKLEHFSFH